MEALFMLFIYVGIPLGLLLLGLVAGSYKEKKHYASIHAREAQFSQIPCLNSKTVPPGNYLNARLVMGSVVVSVDRFKQFLAALRNIFGGEVVAFSSLIDRARREALLRMKEAAPRADLFLNVRLETSTISAGAKKTLGSVEVLAYGTALRVRKE